MSSILRSLVTRLATPTGLIIVLAVGPVRGEPPVSPCTEDAMIVFDASGSMSGNMEGGIGTLKPRIDEVRGALAEILPEATRFRRVGLITYGPGPGEQCNVRLDLSPTANAASQIMRDLDALSPAGKTPLTTAVAKAADVLDYRKKPGMIVVLTDGEETCGASPCELGKELRAAAAQLTVHIIGFRMPAICKAQAANQKLAAAAADAFIQKCTSASADSAARKSAARLEGTK
jgi:Ca-activated chloride channel family protein